MNRQAIKRWTAAALAGLVFSVSAQGAPGRDAHGRLVSSDGHALYVYDADTAAGRSDCTGPCAAVWPPDEAPAAAPASEGFSAITRADGRRQWAWHGHPLYRYAGDANASDTHGDGVNGTWHLAR